MGYQYHSGSICYRKSLSLSFCLSFGHYLLKSISKILLATNTLLISTTITLLPLLHQNCIHRNVPYRNIKNRFTLPCLKSLTFPQTSTSHLQIWGCFPKVCTHQSSHRTAETTGTSQALTNRLTLLYGRTPSSCWKAMKGDWNITRERERIFTLPISAEGPE